MDKPHGNAFVSAAPKAVAQRLIPNGSLRSGSVAIPGTRGRVRRALDGLRLSVPRISLSALCQGNRLRP